MIQLPPDVNDLIKSLENHGFEAYAIGGCVRDLLIGKDPTDWDITTNAIPEEIKGCFPQNRIFETGPGHGAVTLRLGGNSYEVTTYREGAKALKEDMEHRDFTINAMAYHPQKGRIDFFGGLEDLNKRCIRTVGSPDDRFREDGLRILRALRFSAELGFSIEENTAASATGNRQRLQAIAAERLGAELYRLLLGANVRDVLLRFADILCAFLPEIQPLIGFDQNNPHHHLDVWRHTVEAVAHAPADGILRLTLLFHDMGKPRCYGKDPHGIGHFCGHPQYSADIAVAIMKRLKYPATAIQTVKLLIQYHDVQIPPRDKPVKRWLNRLGENNFRRLLEVKEADAKAQHPQYQAARLAQIAALGQCMDDVLAKGQCFRLGDLAIKGEDLLALGIPEGPMIGSILHRLLNLVIEGEIKNDRTALLKAAAVWASKEK